MKTNINPTVANFWKRMFFLKSSSRYKFCNLVLQVTIVGLCGVSPFLAHGYTHHSMSSQNVFILNFPNDLHLVLHYPGGDGTWNHDYYAASNDPWVAELIDLVNRGHVRHILPDMQRAARNLETGSFWYEQAWKEIEYTLKRLVNHPKALMFAPMVAQALNKPHLPAMYYERALSLYPQHAITYAQYGNFLVGLGQTKKGIAQLEKAIKMDSKLSAGYVWLSQAYLKNGQLDLAREFRARARELGYQNERNSQQ